MSMPANAVKNSNKKGFLGWIEALGNKLPHPIFLFMIFCFIILLFSYLGHLFNWQAVNPVTKEKVQAFNILSKEGLAKVFTSFQTNIMGFRPLTDILIIILGISMLEKTGLISTILRRFFVNLSAKYLTLVVVFVGVSSSVASDAGFMVLPPLAGMLFYATGRNPLVGIIAAYGSVAAGFASSFFLGVVEVVGFGFTEQAARLLDPGISVPIVSNFYFTFISAFLLPLTAFFVTEKIVSPRLGHYNSEEMNEVILEKTEITKEETSGLNYAGIALLLYIVVILLLVLPSNGILRGEGGSVLNSPFMSSIILIVAGAFFFPGLAYGIKTKSIRSDKDAVRIMTEGISGFAGYILVAIFLSQLIKFMEWSNLGLISAINGAEILKSSGIPIFFLILATILFTALLDLIMPSHAGKLALMAPILVPMFMLLDTHPSVTYLAYRIGDSISNAVSPLMPYFVILLGFVHRYKKNVGMGTLIANLLPYSISFLMVYVAMFIVWYVLGLPLGPGVEMDYQLSM
ncbi:MULTISPECIES: AbgT family transporter [unclassified Paenibacillus]|uniref:AbgT family transporter n=1 Tax=unclassified Paenibacillus TaxID=185978 RepID=UPI001AE7E3BC|nr:MULTISPECIES: AbgT family transporter [unclassified Paenibacillus]MBP1154871.1 aminobenzoyl-glutamate transport protein [Paenibacillus sp. PvP091]MBP1169745.1 aminobenzoyl-glutamate transport protein [Paenibacillus sp. PvR098]MBP2440773.1 aminobenzoyl-glutamate transport protein [Paenibacillus sp. PvP052]